MMEGWEGDSVDVSILCQTSSILNSEVAEDDNGIFSDEKSKVTSDTLCDEDESDAMIWLPGNETTKIPIRLPRNPMNIQNAMLQATQKKKLIKNVFNNSSKSISIASQNKTDKLSAKEKFGRFENPSKKVQEATEDVEIIPKYVQKKLTGKLNEPSFQKSKFEKTVNKKKLIKEDLVKPVEAKKSISSIFDFEDDPLVLEILSRKKQEAVRGKVEIKKRKRESMAKMAEFNQCHVESLSLDANCQEFSSDDESEPKFKILNSKKSANPSQQNINFFFKTGYKVSKEEDKLMGSPSIDELLKLPDRQEASGKTKDEVLDDLDKVIADRKMIHEKEMTKVDIWIAAEKRRQDERSKRMKSNAFDRDRLEAEVTEVVLRRMFKDNLDYLKKIQSGQIESFRHQAYNKSCRTRHALYFNMITDPFTDEQLEWTLNEIGQVWMKNKKEQMDNNEYVWKVLLAECFIKFYMDHFSVSKEEAEKRISETPLRNDGEDSDEGSSNVLK